VRRCPNDAPTPFSKHGLKHNAQTHTTNREIACNEAGRSRSLPPRRIWPVHGIPSDVNSKPSGSARAKRTAECNGAP